MERVRTRSYIAHTLVLVLMIRMPQLCAHVLWTGGGDGESIGHFTRGGTQAGSAQTCEGAADNLLVYLPTDRLTTGP